MCSVGRAGLQQDVAFETDAVDQLELGLDEIDLVFLTFEDVAEQVARHEIAHPFAMGDRLAQARNAGLLEPQIAFEDLAHILADQQFVEILQVGQAVEKQDALDQLVGILHLVDRLVILVVAELRNAPMAQHTRMQEVLIDRGQFVFEHRIEMLDDGGIAPHGRPPRLAGISLNWEANAAGPKAITRLASFYPTLRSPRPGAASGGRTARICRIAAGSRRHGRPSIPSSLRPRYGDA